MDVSAVWRWLQGELPRARYTDHAVARQVYADYMRAQILGTNPSDRDALLAALTVERADGVSEAAPFPDLMGVEIRLAATLDDDMVEQNYWIVRERFNRVVPAGVIEEHSRWAPPGLVEPDERMPIAGTTDPARPGKAEAAAGTTGAEGDTAGDGDDVDAVEPPIDPAALDTEAEEREAELRHEQMLALAAEPDDAADAASPSDDPPPEDPAAAPREKQ